MSREPEDRAAIPVALIRGGAAVVAVATVFSFWASPDRVASLPWSVAAVVGALLVILATGRWRASLAGRLQTKHISWFFLGLGFGSLAATLFASHWAAYKFSWLNSVYAVLPNIRSLHFAGQGLQPNQTGAILAVLTAFSVTVAAWPTAPDRAPSRRRRRTALVLSVLGTIGVFMSGSRAALAGLLVVCLATVIIRTRRMLWAWFLGLMAIGIGLFSSGLYSRLIGLFVEDEGLNTKLASRLDIWSSALRGIQDHFFTGIGLGVFNQVMPARYPYHVVGLTFTVSQAHNLFLDVALAIGVPGLLGFLLMIAGCIMLGLRRIDHKSEPGLLALGILASLVVYLVFGITDSISLSVPTSFIVWLWACSLVILYDIGRRRTLGSGEV